MLKTLGALLVVALAISLYVEVAEGIPADAPMLIDTRTGRYLSPPCYSYFYEGVVPATNFDLVRYGELRGSDLKPDPQCREAGGLTGSSSKFLIWLLLRESRFDDAGNWKW